MEERHGDYGYVELALTKTEPEVLKAISANREIEETVVKKLMRFNAWTVNQFKDLTGLAVSTIANKTKQTVKDGKIVTELDYCYPHPDNTGEGQKFILRNEKSLSLIDCK